MTTFDSVMGYLAFCARFLLVTVAALVAVLILVFLAFGLGLLMEQLLIQVGW